MKNCICGNPKCPYPFKARTFQHGTYQAYQSHKCRCAECRHANVERTQIVRERMRRSDRTNWVHGKVYTYTMLGCRCDDCTDANTIASREYRERTGYDAKRLERDRQRRADERERLQKAKKSEVAKKPKAKKQAAMA